MTDPIQHKPITLSMLAQVRKKKKPVRTIPITPADEKSNLLVRTARTINAGFKMPATIFNLALFFLISLCASTYLLRNALEKIIDGLHNGEGHSTIDDFSEKKDSFSKEKNMEREKLYKSITKDSKNIANISEHHAKLIEYGLPAVTLVKDPSGQGTGFIYSKSGIIITNNHVIVAGKNDNSPSQDIEVTFYNGEKRMATVIAQDTKNDIAAIKIDPYGLDLPTLSLSSKEPRAGESVVGLGNPRGLTWSAIPTNVAAVKRVIEADKGKPRMYLQLVHGPAGGASGSPVIDIYGNVVGLCVKSYLVGGDGFGIPAMPLIYAFVRENKLDEK